MLSGYHVFLGALCVVTELCSSDVVGGTIGAVLSSSFAIVFLPRAVDGDLDCNLTTLDVLAIHLLDGLVLHFLVLQSNEAKATAFAGFVASLELLDHESWDRTEGDLGRRWLIGSEEFFEL